MSFQATTSFKRCWLALAVAVIAIAAVATSHTAATAQLYRCQDGSGGVEFTNIITGPSCKPYVRKGSRQAAAKSRSTARLPKIAMASSSIYDSDIKRVARHYNIDPALIKAIIHTESSFDHRAVSRSGAQGLMQLMPGTADELDVENPFDPQQNIDGGTRYLRNILNDFDGDLILSLAAYNAGPGLVRRSGVVPNKMETRQYVYKVLKRYKAYKTSWGQKS